MPAPPAAVNDQGRSIRSFLAVCAYLGAAIGANLTIAAWGPWVSPLVAFLFIGLDLSGRDVLHEAWEGKWLWPRMLALIAAGSLLSYLANPQAGAVSLASAAAFLSGALADTLVYAALAGAPRLVKMNASNLVSGAVDTLVFFPLAFASLPLAPAGVQYLAKIAGGALWAAALAWVWRKSNGAWSKDQTP